MAIDYSKIEPLARPMVKYFNEVWGLKTTMSCQGHWFKRGMKGFWIEFDESVTQDMISTFQSAHTPIYMCFVSEGHFVRRMFVDKTYGPTRDYIRWRYMARNAKAAMKDLRRWQAEDKKNGLGRKK